MTRLSARGLIETLVDENTWQSWDVEPDLTRASADYATELAATREATGVDEAVLTGSAHIRGHHVAILVSEFGFLGGSIGIATGERIAAAVRLATKVRLPLLVLPSSGGTRMQEGSKAFLQMVRITAAVSEHKAAGLPYLVYLRHPSTGGVFASFGSLGQMTFAEPGALIGFLGPRVYESLHGTEFPSGVQTAENLYDRGFIDAVLAPAGLADAVSTTLDIVTGTPPESGVAELGRPDDQSELHHVPAWTSVVASRRTSRPGASAIIEKATSVMRLRGTGAGEADDALMVALARFGDISCVVLGQQSRVDGGSAAIRPAALRQARRGMRLAAELALPLVTLIDTPGGELSAAAEEGGLAGEIARCIADMLALDVPTVSVLLGQGTGGTALALLPADRIIAAANGWLSPLPPEGASAILYRSTSKAAEVAERQSIRAVDLRDCGVIDRIVAEQPDAADEPGDFCHRIVAALRAEIALAANSDPDTRSRCRAGRFDRLGNAPSATVDQLAG